MASMGKAHKELLHEYNTRWLITNTRTAGFYRGKESMNNEQTDNVSENSEYSIMHKAYQAWLKWAQDNDITPKNTQFETLKLMSEAFIDGYLNGFTKRFTEGE